MAIHSVNSYHSIATLKPAANLAAQSKPTNEAVALPAETFQAAATQTQPETSPATEVQSPSDTSPQADLPVAEPKSSAPSTLTSNFGTVVELASNGALVEFAPIDQKEGVEGNLESSQTASVEQPAWMDSWFEVAQAQKAQSELDNKLYTTGNPDQPAWMDSMADLVRRPK
jgi:hypothetical protein